MARRKRIPYRPDAFQSFGRRAASTLLDRGRLIVAALVLAVAGFVVAAIVMSMRATAEEGAWTALGRAGGDLAKLRAVLAEYGSSEARPFVLFAIARGEIQPPEEDGRPRSETDDARAARLARAEGVLNELLDGYPDHFLHFYALCLKGQLLEERGRYRDAAAVFETAKASAPKSMVPKLDYDIGRSYYLAGMPNAARTNLEKMIGATGEVFGQEADWISNARYLLARIGPGERAISLEEPEKKPEEKPEEKPGREPGDATPEKALDESAPSEKNAPEGDAAPEDAGGAAAAGTE